MTNLEQLFINCLSPDTKLRKDSELAITNLIKRPNFIFSLSSLFNHKDERIKKMSSVFFKNFTITEWNKVEFANQKAKIITNLIDMLRVSDQSVQLDLSEIIVHYLESERVEDWDVLIKAASLLMQNVEDVSAIRASLLFWCCILKNDKVKYSKELLNTYFQPFGNNLFNALRYSIIRQQYDISKTIAKIYTVLQDQYYSVEFLGDINYFANLYKLMVESFGIECVDQQQMVYKYKKWVVKFFNRTMSRYFKSGDKKTQVGDFFLGEGNFVFLYNIILEILKRETKRETDCEEEKESYLKTCCTFLSILLKDGNQHSEHVKKDISFIVFQFIFPLHLFTEENEEMFNDSPKEYLQHRYGYYTNDLRGYSGILFCDLIKKIKKDKGLFLAIINELINVMNIYKTNPTQENASKKYAALFLISYIAKRLKNSANEFLSEHVIQDLYSRHLFLRSQACFALQFFEGAPVPKEIILPAFDGVINNLKSESVVIKTDSALALSFFVDNQWVQENIKKNVPMIVQILLELQKTNELDALNDLLESIVLTYPEEISLYAPQLTLFLSDIIKNNLGAINEDKTMLYAGFLRTLDSLVITIENKPEIVYNMYCQIAETIYLIFRNRIADLYSETLELLSQFIFGLKRVDDSMWDIFMTIMSIEKEEKYNVSLELGCLLDNYISYGQDRILNYVKLINNCVEAIVQADDNTYFNDEEHIQGCKIIQSLMLNLNTSVTEHIPFFIDICTNHYEEFDRDSASIIYCLEIIMHSFIINFEMTWSKLLRNNHLNTFFEDLYELRNRFNRVMDKKLVLLFTCSLLKSNDTILNNLDGTRIKSILIRNLESLPKAIEKRNALLKEDYDEPEEELYDDLEEDIYYMCPLDKFDAFEFVRNTFNGLGSFGVNVMNSCDAREKALIVEILSKQYYEQ